MISKETVLRAAARLRDVRVPPFMMGFPVKCLGDAPLSEAFLSGRAVIVVVDRPAGRHVFVRPRTKLPLRRLFPKGGAK